MVPVVKPRRRTGTGLDLLHEICVDGEVLVHLEKDMLQNQKVVREGDAVQEVLFVTWVQLHHLLVVQRLDAGVGFHHARFEQSVEQCDVDLGRLRARATLAIRAWVLVSEEVIIKIVHTVSGRAVYLLVFSELVSHEVTIVVEFRGSLHD